ncbi:MAG TPA: sugar phosphate isomerase/epimerase family protein [Candidatus Acidoferrum sp.]|nr:sugar phosphate isomerase/epimerase family protein [Candidatus Acidoferrum sp.]
MNKTLWSRREFVATAALAPLGFRAALALPASSTIPVGIEMYSVRNALAKDPMGTVREVAKAGYQCLEFYGPYYGWAVEQAKEMKKLLDDLGIRCYSTHNDSANFSADKIGHAVEVNKILGCKYVVMASSHEGSTPDAWKTVADILNTASEKLEAAGLRAGYHNHQAEFRGEAGTRPMDILAKNTKPTVMLQLDVGTCIEAGSDPVVWIKANPGRIRSMHCKEWSPEKDKGYAVLFGEGVAPWKQLFDAAEHGGGIEYYLIEQEGSRFSEIETAQKCLASFRATHGA